MSKQLTNCKVCGAEIATTAKVCPSCGAKIKQKHPVLLGIVAVLVLIGIVSSIGGDDEPKKVETPSTNQVETNTNNEIKEEVKESKNEFAVGETAELKGVAVTLLGVTESTGSQFNTPTEGNVFVLCEFEISNNSSSEINVSSMMSFEAYCDDYSCTYSLSALMERGNKNQLDGTVAPGKKFNGVIGYEVPADWAELEIRFTPDVWSGKDIIFVANS